MIDDHVRASAQQAGLQQALDEFPADIEAAARRAALIRAGLAAGPDNPSVAPWTAETAGPKP